MWGKSPFPLAHKGFSLVEIIVAVALLAIFVAATTSLLNVSFKGIMDSGEKSKLNYNAQQVLEEQIRNNAIDRNTNFEILFSTGAGENFLMRINDAGIVEEGSLVCVTMATNIYRAKAGWVNNRLEVTLFYTNNLMADLGTVAVNQFMFQNNHSLIPPNTIEKAGADRAKLTFEGYDFMTGGTKSLTYTQSASGSLRLKDARGNDVKSPETMSVTVPVK